MAPSAKINVKDRANEDGEIDLSMSDLQDVPVREIASIRKVHSLDLSNNNLATLPTTFATLLHITKLDLSKNQLTELPENFGDLIKLRHLDLYRNQLEHLPLSFGKLVALKWLDLNDNPLVPAVAKIAGPCSDFKQCQSCARNVVVFFQRLEKEVDEERVARQKTREKQIAATQQKNETNKKNKKKQRAKENGKKGQVQTNGVDRKDDLGIGAGDDADLITMATTAKRSQQKKLGLNQEGRGSGICLKLFIFAFFIGFALFSLTSIDFRYTNIVEVQVKRIYYQFVDVLPGDVRHYGVDFGVIVKQAHDKTGNLTRTIFEHELVRNTTIILGDLYKDVTVNLRTYYERFFS